MYRYHHTLHKDIEDVQLRDVSSNKRNTALIQLARPRIIWGSLTLFRKKQRIEAKRQDLECLQANVTSQSGKKLQDSNKQDLEYQVVWFSEETGLKLSLTSTLDMQWFSAINPLHPKISMHTLHTVLYTFPKVLMRRICWPIKRFLPWWPFPLFPWP